MNKCSMYRLASLLVDVERSVKLVTVECWLFSHLVAFADSVGLFSSNGRYSVAETHTCSMPAPSNSNVLWNPNFWIRYSMRMGKTKLPAAVPDTQIPFASARRLLKYIETMMIPGVVDKPPPIPFFQNKTKSLVLLLMLKCPNFGKYRLICQKWSANGKDLSQSSSTWDQVRKISRQWKQRFGKRIVGIMRSIMVPMLSIMLIKWPVSRMRQRLSCLKKSPKFPQTKRHTISQDQQPKTAQRTLQTQRTIHSHRLRCTFVAASIHFRRLPLFVDSIDSKALK